MKKTNKYPFKILNAVCVSFILLCSGCNPEVPEQFVDFEIITPKDNRTYYTDEKILFSTNLKNSNFEWTSSIDGFLGTQSLQVLSLSEGSHEIQLTSKLSNIIKTVRIKVI